MWFLCSYRVTAVMNQLPRLIAFFTVVQSYGGQERNVVISPNVFVATGGRELCKERQQHAH
jgi:hypothetical protein